MRGNSKLGEEIWSWGMPSAGHHCPGQSAVCRMACYSKVIEARRPNVWNRYRRNAQRAGRRGFVRAMVREIRTSQPKIVRLHTGGDFGSAIYARKWLAIMKACSETLFYAYTRSWRKVEIEPVLEAMSRLSNVRLWYSADRDTGLPGYVPERVHVAWLLTQPGEEPPRGSNLVFRAGQLRRLPTTRVGGVRVCPVEDGVERSKPVTCTTCKLCWKSLKE